MGKVKAKKKIKFHRYVLHNIEITDKQGKTSVDTYVIYSRKPLDIAGLAKAKEREEITVKGEDISNALLGEKVALLAVRWGDPDLFRSIGADIKKLDSQGDERPVRDTEQTQLLNVVLRDLKAGITGREFTITYEGTVNKREKEFFHEMSKLDTIPSKAKRSEFIEKKVA